VGSGPQLEKPIAITAAPHNALKILFVFMIIN
jgi:hypothetical protein